MRHNSHRRFHFEALEDRRMMAVLPGDFDLNGTVQTAGSEIKRDSQIAANDAHFHS